MAADDSKSDDSHTDDGTGGSGSGGSGSGGSGSGSSGSGSSGSGSSGSGGAGASVGALTDGITGLKDKGKPPKVKLSQQQRDAYLKIFQGLRTDMLHFLDVAKTYSPMFGNVGLFTSANQTAKNIQDNVAGF